jgi:hypothetical protein
MSILDCLDTEAKSNEGAWLHLRRPDSSRALLYLDDECTKPVRIKLKGPDSDTWTRYVRKEARKEALRRQNGEKPPEKTGAEIATEDARIFSRMTMEWENMPVGENDEPVPFDEDTAFEVYRKHKHLRAQILDHILDRDAFFTEPESS